MILGYVYKDTPFRKYLQMQLYIVHDLLHSINGALEGRVRVEVRKLGHNLVVEAS